MNKSPQFSFVIALLVLMFSFNACKPKKDVATSGSPDIIPVNSLIEQIRQNDFDPQWFSGKAAVTYTGDNKTQSFTATIRILKDSIIWASVSPGLGIEVARVMITPDSLKILNRLDQTYQQHHFSHLNKMMNSTLKFSHLQALLMGNYPDYVENSLINNVAVEGNDYILSAILKPGERNSNDAIETIWVHPFTNRIKKLRIDEPASGRTIEAEYKEFALEGNKMFPADAAIKVEQDKAYEVKLKWSKINVNDPFDFPFNVPSGYQKEQ
ncbi:MAG: DUF4292 domain-containing protein [Bacteroidia bacterium]